MLFATLSTVFVLVLVPVESVSLLVLVSLWYTTALPVLPPSFLEILEPIKPPQMLVIKIAIIRITASPALLFFLGGAGLCAAAGA